jgi:hypothetical protein
MTPQEAIDTIKTVIAQIEWDYPMDYAAAFDKAVEALTKEMPVRPKIAGDQRPGRTWWYACGVCMRPVNFEDGYCSQFGRAVKWE